MFPRMTTPTKPYLGRTGMGLTAAILQIVAAVALVVAVALPVNQLTQPGGNVVVTPVDDGTGRPLDLAGLPEGVWVDDADPTAVLHAFDLPVGLRALTELPTVLALVGIAAGAWWLAMVLTSIRRGQPFDRRNPSRLAGVAAAVVLGGLVAPVSESLVATTVLDHLGLTGPASPLRLIIADFPLTPVAVGLLLLAAAEAFRRGGALADDVEGLV